MRTMTMVLWTVAAGCGDCEREGGSCYVDGRLVVDQSGDLPVFRLQDMSDMSREPNEIDVFDCEGGDAWQATRLPEPEVTYGVLPEGATEPFTARPLQPGMTYEVWFTVRDRSPFNDYSGLGPDAWIGTFVYGEPDSLVSGYCHERPAQD